MTLDKDQKIEIQQKIIDKLTAENEQLKQELNSALNKSEEIKTSYEQRKMMFENSQKEFNDMIKEFNEQKKLFEEQMKKVRLLLNALSDDVEIKFD